jgi:2-polyprenyl-3-methyl-5-hydroxy-6-metoxy-1,4-benzoquinol methylase
MCYESPRSHFNHARRLDSVRHPEPHPSWPETWRLAYHYDLEEVYGAPKHLGYAYAYAARRALTLALLTKAVPVGAHVLDIAAAGGNFSLALAEMGYRVTWNDLRAELADYVRLKHDRGQLEFAPGNAFELEFPRLFDAVLITEVIEHVAHPDQFLAKVARLVKPGGHVILTTPNGGYFRNTLPRFSDCPDPSVYEQMQFGPNGDDHIFLLHCDEVQQLVAKAGLELETLELSTNPLTTGHIKLNAALRVLPRTAVDLLERWSRRLPAPLARRLLTSIAARLRRPAS